MLPSHFKCLSENMKLFHDDKNETMENPEGVKVYVKNFGS